MSFRKLIVLPLTVILIATLSWVKPTVCSAQTLSPKTIEQIRGIDGAIMQAGLLFKKGQYEDSAKAVAEAQSAAVKLTKNADAKTIEGFQRTYLKLSKAHQLLTSKGQTLPVLKPLPDPTAKAKPAPKPIPNKTPVPNANTKVSFVNQVAPVLVSNCGKCHVQGSRGGFSAQTFVSLNNSGAISFGSADQSRLIEVMVSGEMPPGNRKVDPAEVAVLKQWINEGASFDGPNPQANIAMLAKNAPAKMEEQPLAVSMPTGKETVSFGLHIAPILLENCAQCHVARRPAGGLNMATFATLIAGGESGKPFVPSKSGMSEIVLRLKGENREVMPPSGKLDDKLISLVEKWIAEGAKFDPADAKLPMQRVASKGLASSLDHEGLTKWRKESSIKKWQLALSGIKPATVTTDDFLLIGTGSESRLEAIGEVSESIADKISKSLGDKTNQPFVKGDTTLFVVDKRYDFSEFGTMIEKRSFDRSLVSSWQSDTADAYVILLAGLGAEASDYEVSLTRDLASVYVANWDASIPRWFADGMGYLTAAKIHNRDPIVTQWQTNAASALSSMSKPDDFLGNAMPADQAALVSYRFVKLLEGKGSAFKKLTKQLRNGEQFNSAFGAAFGTTPNAMVMGKR